MGFFDRLRAKQNPFLGQAASKKPSIVSTEHATSGASSTDQEDTAPVLDQGQIKRELLAAEWLMHPHISEKAASLAEQGTYVFRVPLEAEKIVIKKAVEALYKVRVLHVGIIRRAGKPVHRGRKGGVRVRTKKAMVTLLPGQKIEFS